MKEAQTWPIECSYCKRQFEARQIFWHQVNCDAKKLFVERTKEPKK